MYSNSTTCFLCHDNSPVHLAICHRKGGSGADVGWRPLRSPWWVTLMSRYTLHCGEIRLGPLRSPWWVTLMSRYTLHIGRLAHSPSSLPLVGYVDVALHVTL